MFSGGSKKQKMTKNLTKTSRNVQDLFDWNTLSYLFLGYSDDQHLTSSYVTYTLSNGHSGENETNH